MGRIIGEGKWRGARLAQHSWSKDVRWFSSDTKGEGRAVIRVRRLVGPPSAIWEWEILTRVTFGGLNNGVTIKGDARTIKAARRAALARFRAYVRKH